ncbi:MAG: hypothetical protein JSV24_01160 [Bacteroidales bacterium]|nr:MAG: hypothetical protein JSV24_01160 [Bacteroidales bacterium]
MNNTASRFTQTFYLAFLILSALVYKGYSQVVPMALKYQAVARNSSGEELVNANIDVRMSVIAGNPDGVTEWKEIHSNVQTSRFGLFTVLVGKGERSGGIVERFEDIPWSESNHYLKVEIKFNQEFLVMGTSQFLSVPYALFAQKALNPGPQGPPGPQGEKGDPGDPASDDQTLSFEGENLSIEGGNTVNLGTLKQYLSLKGDTLSLTNGNYVMLTDVVDDADADPTNELQDLSIEGKILSITYGNSITLPDSVDDADADPNNEIQDLELNEHILKITGNPEANPIDLSGYLDNSDNQQLSYDPATHILTLSDGGTVDLTGLLEDDDPDPSNEIQDLQLNGNILTITRNGSPTSIDLAKYLDNTDDQQLTYNSSSGMLTLENGGNADLSELKNIPLVGFRALKETTSLHVTVPDSAILKFENEIYDYGDVYDPSAGLFTTPENGVYFFYVTFNSGSKQTVKVLKNGSHFTTFFGGSTSSFEGFTSFSFMEYLYSGETISIQVNIDGIGNCGIGTFSGFRVH